MQSCSGLVLHFSGECVCQALSHCAPNETWGNHQRELFSAIPSKHRSLLSVAENLPVKAVSVLYLLSECSHIAFGRGETLPRDAELLLATESV